MGVFCNDFAAVDFREELCYHRHPKKQIWKFKENETTLLLQYAKKCIKNTYLINSDRQVVQNRTIPPYGFISFFLFAIQKIFWFPTRFIYLLFLIDYIFRVCIIYIFQAFFLSLFVLKLTNKL